MKWKGFGRKWYYPGICLQRLRKITTTSVKAQLDGAWLGSYYVITDVIDKESFISRNLWT
jgi:hypothetical protein